MYQVVEYHRPTSVPEAVQLLAADGRVALAGGVHLRHDGGAAPTEVVDLQALALDGVRITSSDAVLGATVRLQMLVDDDRLPEVIRDAARLEQPSTLRTLATVGGAIVAASGDSLLLAALLVHDAVVTVTSHRDGTREVPLVELLAAGCRHDELILDVHLQLGGAGATARTGRTPGDVAIVGAVGRRVTGGSPPTLAVCGVGDVPLLVDPAAVASLRPVDDHRASAAYRRHLVEVLTSRVLEDLA